MATQQERFSSIMKKAEHTPLNEMEKEELKDLATQLGAVRDMVVTGGKKVDCFYVDENYLPCIPSSSTSAYCHRVFI